MTGAKIKPGTLGVEHFRSANLPQGPRGPQGERGPQGDRGPKGDIGPSDAYVTRGSVFNLTTTSMTVATLTLPAGKYVIYTQALLTNPSTTDPVAVGCSISAGGSLGETITLDPRGGAHYAHHSLIYWEDMATGGTVTMRCGVVTGLIGYPGTAATATFPNIAAIKVGTLNVTP